MIFSKCLMSVQISSDADFNCTFGGFGGFSWWTQWIFLQEICMDLSEQVRIFHQKAAFSFLFVM